MVQALTNDGSCFEVRVPWIKLCLGSWEGKGNHPGFEPGILVYEHRILGWSNPGIKIDVVIGALLPPKKAKPPKVWVIHPNICRPQLIFPCMLLFLPCFFCADKQLLRSSWIFWPWPHFYLGWFLHIDTHSSVIICLDVSWPSKVAEMSLPSISPSIHQRLNQPHCV